MSLYRVRTVFSGPQGAPWVNTLYFDAAAGTAQQAATAVRAFWAVLMDPIKSNVTAQVELEVATLNSTTGATEAVSPVTATVLTGLATGEPLPLATQGLIRLRTGVFFAGKEIRGRCFVPGITENFSSTGRPDSALTAYMNTASTGLLAATGTELVVWSRTTGQYAPVVTMSPWSEFAVLRSRRD